MPSLRLCVSARSERSHPGSDGPPGGDRLHGLPPPPGAAVPRRRIDPAAVGPSAPAARRGRRLSRRTPGLVILHLRHAAPQTRRSERHAPPQRPPGRFDTPNRRRARRGAARLGQGRRVAAKHPGSATRTHIQPPASAASVWTASVQVPDSVQIKKQKTIKCLKNER